MNRRCFSVIKAQAGLAIKLAGLLVIAGALLWQLAVSSASETSGIFAAAPLAIAILGGVFVFIMLLAAMLVLVRRHFEPPIRTLADSMARQQDGAVELPPSLLDRTDDIGRLAGEIQQMLDALTKQNEQLLEETLYDPLTELGNRRLLDRRLQTAIPLSQRMMAPVSALMIDVDHFKAYNDYYGHPAGDACLIEIADVLRDTFRRETDIIIRLGGEEFLVVLLDTGGDDSLQMAEAMRGMLQLVALPHEQSDTADVVTVSVGVATVEPGTPVDTDQLIACADSALYECKSHGRNRSSHHANDIEIPAA